MASPDARTMGNDSCMSPTTVEKSRSKKSHFSSRSLSRGNFSWSFVRNALQSTNRNGTLPPLSTGSCSCDEFTNAGSSGSSISDTSGVSSDACSSSRSPMQSLSSVSRSHAMLSKGSSGQRKGSKLASGERQPVLVEKIPFGKSSKYLTVYVGPRIEQSVKYVISRTLLTHPLFQVLLKCSEDELGEDFSVDKGVAIVCDPALFLQVVRAVDDSMSNEQMDVSEDIDCKLGQDV